MGAIAGLSARRFTSKGIDMATLARPGCISGRSSSATPRQPRPTVEMEAELAMIQVRNEKKRKEKSFWRCHEIIVLVCVEGGFFSFLFADLTRQGRVPLLERSTPRYGDGACGRRGCNQRSTRLEDCQHIWKRSSSQDPHEHDWRRDASATEPPGQLGSSHERQPNGSTQRTEKCSEKACKSWQLGSLGGIDARQLPYYCPLRLCSCNLCLCESSLAIASSKARTKLHAQT